VDKLESLSYMGAGIIGWFGEIFSNSRLKLEREERILQTTHSITEVIRERYSVRIYKNTPIEAATQAELQARLEAIREGPHGTPVRFKLAAAADGDSQALRGLGTYGLIRNPTGFIVGAARANGHNGEKDHTLEDYGYVMEQAILEATALGLGTCWLGGNFTKSSFGKRIDKGSDEIVPAVSVVGYADASSRTRDRLRRKAHSDQRLPWENLFFEGQWEAPITAQSAGDYAEALEMARLAPSASNKQPWRVIRDGQRWHFYCQRTPGYGKGSLIFTLLNIADLQRLDIGIAMCHFELTVREQGLEGEWVSADPGLAPADKNTVYISSWLEKDT
jgi:nitroreductase